MKLSYVLEVNKERIVLNLIKHYMWSNEDIKGSLFKCCEKLADYQGLEKDINANDIKSYMKKYIVELKDLKNFKNFIKEIRFQACNPRTLKKLMEHEGIEKFKSEKELHTFILNYVISTITK